MEHILADRYIQAGFAGFCFLLLMIVLYLIRVLLRLLTRCVDVIANNNVAMNKVDRTGRILLRMISRARRRAEESCPIDRPRDVEGETA